MGLLPLWLQSIPVAVTFWNLSWDVLSVVRVGTLTHNLFKKCGPGFNSQSGTLCSIYFGLPLGVQEPKPQLVSFAVCFRV